MQHGGLTDLLYGFVQDLGITGRMIPLHLVYIQISHCSLSLCLICGVHSLFRSCLMHISLTFFYAENHCIINTLGFVTGFQ
jgi:hypothetical protein